MVDVKEKSLLDSEVISAVLSEIQSKLDLALSEIHAIRQLVGPFAATFPDGSMLCQTIHGNKYFIDTDDMVIAPQMIVYRQWEAQLSELFRRLCTENTVAIDVGANFGYFTCLAASLIGPHGAGRVYAFEPNPRLAELVRRNIEINWSMAPVDFSERAVADFSGAVQLQIPDGHGANGTLSRLEDGAKGKSVAVEAIRLDDVIPADVAVDLLKIDVEGHELGVLKGAQSLIARSPNLNIIMEWSLPQMRQAGVDPAEIVALLKEFQCYDAEGSGNPLDQTARDPAWLLNTDYANILFTRTEGVKRELYPPPICRNRGVEAADADSE